MLPTCFPSTPHPHTPTSETKILNKIQSAIIILLVNAGIPVIPIISAYMCSLDKSEQSLTETYQVVPSKVMAANALIV